MGMRIDGRCAVSHNDFYAGAIAVAGIILFAKFVAHGPRHKCDEPRGCIWKFFHVVCVIAALVAVIVSFAILGEIAVPTSWPGFVGWPQEAERDMRVVVFWAVVVAAVILAVDVAWPSEPGATLADRSKSASAR